MFQWEFLAQKQEMLVFKEKNWRLKNTIPKAALLDYHLLLRETHEKTLKTYSSPCCQKTTSHCCFTPTVATTHTPRRITKVTRDFHPKLNVSFNLLRVRLWMCTHTISCLKYLRHLKGRRQSYCDIFSHRVDPSHTYTQDQTAKPTPESKQWIKHSRASLWCFDPRLKHEYIQHINSILPNLGWLVMRPPSPACRPICDDTSAPPFQTNKLTNTRHNVLTENLH